MIYTFDDDEIAKCKQAMDKPAPLACLRAIVSGGVSVILSHDGRDDHGASMIDDAEAETLKTIGDLVRLIESRTAVSA